MSGPTKTRVSPGALRAARLFYALPIDVDTIKAGAEIPENDGDLVAAHLTRRNLRSSTVAETLSGFVVLERLTHRTYLADLRDSRQVFCVERSQGEPRLAFDSVTVFRKYQTARGRRSGEEDDRLDELLAARFRPKPLETRSSRPVSTPELFARYKWLARFLEPWNLLGEDREESAGAEAGRILRGVFDARQDELAAFHEERPYFRTDLHLAIYWLLHASILAEPDLVAHVRNVLADDQRPLVRAFLHAFGQLAPTDELPCIPGFRERRSWLLYGLGGWREPRDVERLATALKIAPDCGGFLKAASLLRGAEEVGAIDMVRAFSRAHPGPGLGLIALTALLDQRDGAASSAAADAVFHAWPPDGHDEYLGPCLDSLHSLAMARDRVRALIDRALADDPYHWTLLHVARDAAERDGDCERTEDFTRRIAEVDGIGDVIKALQERDAAERARSHLMVDELSLTQRHLLARRLLYLKFACSDVLVAALRILLDTGDPAALCELRAVAGRRGRANDFSRAFELLRPEGLHDLRDPLVPLVLWLLRLPETGEASAYSWKSGLLDLLRPIAHEAPIFTWLVESLVADDVASLREGLLMDVLSLDASIVPRLSDAQADQLVRTLVSPSVMAHDRLNGFAHMVWLDFDHAGGIPAILELLDISDDEGVRANLYTALASIKTPEARRLMWGRLFAERLALGSLCSELAEVLDDGIHEEVMQALAQTRDMFAVCTYATVFLDFWRRMNRRPHACILSIAEEILRWPEPTDPRDRGRRKYVLRQATRLAIERGDHDLARRAHRAAAAIRQRILCDYHVQLSGRTIDPFFADRSVKRWLTTIIAGRATPHTPTSRRISPDADLERLAGVPIDRRIGMGPGGEVWFLDRAGRLWTSDGDTARPSLCQHIHAIRALHRFLADAIRCDERMFLWSLSTRKFRDIARYGDRLLVVEREMCGPIVTVASSGFLAQDVSTAAALFKLLVAQTPAAWTARGAWHLPGVGAIVRVYSGVREPTTTVRALTDTDAARVAAEAEALACMQRPGVWISAVRVDGR